MYYIRLMINFKIFVMKIINLKKVQLWYFLEQKSEILSVLWVKFQHKQISTVGLNKVTTYVNVTKHLVRGHLQTDLRRLIMFRRVVEVKVRNVCTNQGSA